MGQCIEDTLFSCDVVLAVPLKVLICECRFPVDCGAEGVVGFNGVQGVQERSKPCCVGSNVNWLCGLDC